MNVATIVIKSRHSVRKYKPEPISEDAIKDAILSGCSAPSSMNLQPWLIGVVKQKDKLKKLLITQSMGSLLQILQPVF